MIKVSYKLYLVIFGIIKVMDGFGKINLSEYIKDAKQYQEKGGVIRAFSIASFVTVCYGLLILWLILRALRDSNMNIEKSQMIYSVIPIFLLLIISIILKVIFLNGKIILKE